ncbi:MAG: hypothetical protein JNK94_08545 [Hyphomonadaceae bacterium]|nr:hypothetical protein [Hyphomonadaceae bacterium]
MRRVTLLAALSAAAMLSACGIGAPSYPQFGQASYRLEGMTTPAAGGAPTRTVIYRDGPKMRVEATLPQLGQATVVFDESTNAAYVLNPTSQTPVTTSPAIPPGQTPLAQPANPAQPGAAAPVAPPVAGVAVQIPNADAPQPLETAWAALGGDHARHVGRCNVAGEAGHEWRPREAPQAGVERTACITEDGVVLRVSEAGRVLWEATSLQRGPQDAALFGVPPGYQLIDPHAAANAVSENLQQLDSVTGAQPQAPAQPPAQP